MTVSVTDQALFFAGALVMGAAVGLLYDAFRILRVRVRLPLLGGVLDLLFWLVVTVALFVYTTTAGSGEVRLYIVAAVLLGAAAYFWLLSRWFLKLGYRLADLVGETYLLFWEVEKDNHMEGISGVKSQGITRSEERRVGKEC